MVQLHQPVVGQHIELATYGPLGQDPRHHHDDRQQQPSPPWFSGVRHGKIRQARGGGRFAELWVLFWFSALVVLRMIFLSVQVSPVRWRFWLFQIEGLGFSAVQFVFRTKPMCLLVAVVLGLAVVVGGGAGSEDLVAPFPFSVRSFDLVWPFPWPGVAEAVHAAAGPCWMRGGQASGWRRKGSKQLKPQRTSLLPPAS